MNRKALAHILGSIAAILLLFLLPDNTGRLFGLVVNIGYVVYIRGQMRDDVDKNTNYSVQYIHWFKGLLVSLIGWAILIIVAVAVVISQTIFNIATPGHALYYSTRGENYQNQGDYEQAITEYTKAIQLDPSLSSPFYNRGIAYSRIGDYENAILDFTHVIETNPNDSEAYFERGNNYFQKSDFESAIRDYSKVIQLIPNYDRAYNNRGVAYEKLGQNDKAIMDFKKVLEITKDVNLKQGVEAELHKLEGN